MSFSFVLLMRRMTNESISFGFLQRKICWVFGIGVDVKIGVIFFFVDVDSDCFIVDIFFIIVFDSMMLFFEHFIIFHVVFSME